jgi:hypothetical protein
MFGYRTPRPFSITQINQAIDYDFGVVEKWTRYLHDYLKKTDFLKNKVVLELGPGPDLGIGLIFLAEGVRKYIGLDINRLAYSTPQEFYKRLLNFMLLAKRG